MENNAFTQEQRLALTGIRNSIGLKAVFDVMEHVCIESENTFLGENPVNEKEVLKHHAVLYAQRAFKQRVVELIASLSIAPTPEQATHLTSDQKIRRSINPIAS